ncbi:MAG: hypothetical protein K6E33_03610, partial [Lachnospiraceae bacterium]|nr:hypothetical protein [Lachnospiraceae bacterium]
MDELTSLYYDIVNKIENVDLGEEILAVHEQLTDIENRDINILKTASDYLVGLPEDKTSKFSVCVLGAAGHRIAHLIEMRYPGADVYWINNTNDNPEQYDGVMDYMICERDPDIVFDSWKWSLHDGSTVIIKKEMVFKSTDEKKETIDIINRCCRSGFSFGIYSNDMFRLTRVIPERAAESLESKYKKVYVACPSFIKTGGPELLHQLVYWLNHYFGNAV